MADAIAEATEADRGFVEMLDAGPTTLVVSAMPGLVACIGAEAGQLTASMTRAELPLGIGAAEGRLALATQRGIDAYALSYRLARHYPPRPCRHDGIFVKVGTWRTGECSVHDLALDGPSAVFVNTLFSCISRADMRHSFVPLWRPGFVSALMPEDRCHLNSFALEGGRLRYATAFAATDTHQGYRAAPLDSGMLMEVPSGRMVLGKLMKPHSVRLLDGGLYVLNSAAGEVLRVDAEAGRAEVLARLPGFTRGLWALGDVLLVGLSRLRPSAAGLSLPVAREHAALVAGIAAIDRRSGALKGMLRFPDAVEEVFDFCLVPGLRRALVQPQGDGQVAIETPDSGYWMRAGR